MKRIIIFLLSVVVWFSGCSRVEVSPDKVSRFRKITAEAVDVILPENGSFELSFSVEDPDFGFDYDASSEGCQILLQTQRGQLPEYYKITSINKGSSPGEYVVTISDCGTERFYSEIISLVYVTFDNPNGNDKVISNCFLVESEALHKGIMDLDTGLPVVYLCTDDREEIVSKDTYKDAVLTIDGLGLYQDLDSTRCQLRGRGNTTWTWAKKPYLIKLEKKAEILGMPKHKRWVLLANFMDRTMMRNIVAYKVSSMTSLDWTPRCVPVELVLNGTHRGNYLLIEQVRVDNDRVDITEMQPSDVSGDAVTGGYLLELDFHYDNKIQWTDYHGRCNQMDFGIPFGVKSPDEDDIVSAQVMWIKSYIEEVASTIYGDAFADPEDGYAKYLDVQSFVDYWIVFELMGNHELGNPGSVFVHKDRGGKLVAGPAWDFDWGSLSYNTSPHAKTGLINVSAIWYARLMEDPAFKSLVKERWNALKPSFETIPDFITQQKELLSASAVLNFKMWNPADDRSMNGWQIINGDENLDFSEAVDRISSIFSDRLTVMDGIIGEW